MALSKTRATKVLVLCCLSCCCKSIGDWHQGQPNCLVTAALQITAAVHEAAAPSWNHDNESFVMCCRVCRNSSLSTL